MDAAIDVFATVIPLIVAAIVPALVAGLKHWASDLPSAWIPVLLPLGGGLLSALGVLVGAEVAPNALHDADAFSAAVTGILVGSAAVGLHQAKKHIKKGGEE